LTNSTVNHRSVEAELYDVSYGLLVTGFPSDINTDEITRVCQKCSDLDLQPMTVMAALLRTEDEVNSLA